MRQAANWVASGLEDFYEGREQEVLCWALWRQLHHSQKRGVSSCRDRGGCCIQHSGRACRLYLQWRRSVRPLHLLYEGGECCQDECIGGLKSGYLDGIGTSLSSEEGAEPVGGDKLIWKCHDELAHGLLAASTYAESPPRVGFLSPFALAGLL